MPRFASSSPEISIQSKLASTDKSGLSFLRRFAADFGPFVLGRFLAPLRGFFVATSLPTAGAVGCILSPLRGFPISLRGRYQWRDHTRLNISAGVGIERDSGYQRWGSKATFTRTLVSASAGVYFHFLTALTAHSARMGLPPTTEIVSTEPAGETTTSRRTMPPM